MKKLGLILILVITACSWAKPITWPSGTKGWVVQCSDEADCLVKDGEMCPNGYNIQWRDNLMSRDFIACNPERTSQ